MPSGPITAMTRQLDILQALTAQLQGITPANGYNFDMSASVYRGITVFGDDKPPPALSILEAPRPGIEVTATTDLMKRLTSWEILVQGWAEDDKLNPLDPVYALKASVEHRLARVGEAGGGTGAYYYPAEAMLGLNSAGKYRIASIQIGPGVCRPPDAKISPRAFFYLPVTLKYNEDLSAPFV
jgi:hypothetical protein